MKDTHPAREETGPPPSRDAPGEPLAAPGPSRIPGPLGSRPLREVLVVSLVLAALTAGLHGSSLLGNWRADDGDHLRFALTHEPWQYFFLPEVNRAHHAATITPWNVFFYDVNLGLFGFTPAGHYFHLLAVITLSALLFYLLLRNWLGRAASAAGASALLLSPATIHIAQFLMVGHYATGLLLCLVAAYGWVRFVRGGSGAWLALGAASYLLSTLCKEVAVPLLFVVAFLPCGSRKRRAWAFLPFLAVAIAYTLWRRIVLGVFVGGSSPTGEGFVPLATLKQIAAVPYLLFGGGPAAVIGVLLLLAGLVLAARRGRLSGPLLAALIVAVAVPLLPLTINPGIRGADRYLFFPAVALAAGAALLWPRETNGWWRFIPAGGVLACLAVGHVRQQRGIQDELRRTDALYGFAVTADPLRQGLFVEGDPGYFMSVLPAAREARDLFEGRAPSGRLLVLTDNPAALPVLAGNDWRSRSFFRYEKGSLRPMSQGEIARAVAPQLDALSRGRNHELRVELSHESGTLHWNFGPWDGAYQVNLPDGGLRLSRKGAHPWAPDRPIEMSVCFEGPNLWVACSPRLRFDPAKGSLVWAGPGVVNGLEAPASPR